VAVLCVLLPSDGVVSVSLDAQVYFFRLLPFLTFFSNLFSRVFFFEGKQSSSLKERLFFFGEQF